jgi:hypothetical protein
MLLRGWPPSLQDVRNGHSSATSQLLCQERRLVVAALPKPIGVYWNRDEHCIWQELPQRRDRRPCELCQRPRHPPRAPVFQAGKRLPERATVGEGRYSNLKGIADHHARIGRQETAGITRRRSQSVGAARTEDRAVAAAPGAGWRQKQIQDRHQAGS